MVIRGVIENQAVTVRTTVQLRARALLRYDAIGLHVIVLHMTSLHWAKHVVVVLLPGECT